MSKHIHDGSFAHCEGMGVRRFVKVNSAVIMDVLAPKGAQRRTDPRNWQIIDRVLTKYGYCAVTFDKLKGGDTAESRKWIHHNVSHGHRTSITFPCHELGLGARLFSRERDLVEFLLHFR